MEGPTAAGEGSVSWSWSELDRIADLAALQLAEAGVGPGQAVATLLPSSPEAMALMHAVPRAGGVLVPVNPAWTRDEVRRALQVVGRPRLLLVPGPEVAAVRRDLRDMGTVAVEEIVPMRPATAEPPQDPTLRPAIPEPSSDTPVAVVLTSGSTGSPSLVPLTHGNLMASARGAVRRLGLDPMDRWLASLSPAHVGGLALLHRAAVVGCGVISRPRFKAVEFLELARRGEVSHASLVPVMLRRVLEEAGAGEGGAMAPRGLRCLLVGGAHLPQELLMEALRLRWPIALTYGMTEASSQVATAPPARVRQKPGTVGRALPDVVVRVDEPDADGVGELLVRGPTVAPLPPQDEPTTRPSVYLDASGWLHTGDLGRMDDEGDLWISGRISDRIVTGGVTVEPAEVEASLLAHPDVAAVVVVGVPDPEWGERIRAVVVPTNPSDPPATEDLLAFAGAHLSAARRPREVRFLDELPRNASGKVDRSVLRRAD